MKVKTHICVVICTLFGVPAISHAGEWSYEIEPYGLFANIEGDAGVGRATGAEVDVDFDTILENLELAAMLHFEAPHKNGLYIKRINDSFPEIQ